MTSTKCPPISATIKSILTTLPSLAAQIKNDAVTERVFCFILILLNNELFIYFKISNIFSFVARIGLMIYSCLSLALLCDLYFIPSLELIGSGIYKVIGSII